MSGERKETEYEHLEEQVKELKSSVDDTVRMLKDHVASAQDIGKLRSELQQDLLRLETRIDNASDSSTESVDSFRKRETNSDLSHLVDMMQSVKAKNEDYEAQSNDVRKLLDEKNEKMMRLQAEGHEMHPKDVESVKKRIADITSMMREETKSLNERQSDVLDVNEAFLNMIAEERVKNVNMLKKITTAKDELKHETDEINALLDSIHPSRSDGSVEFPQCK